MTSRRSFIAAGTVAAGGALLAAPAAAAPASARSALVAELFSRLNAPYRHKQAFAAARIDNASIFSYMKNSLNAYQFAFNEGPGTLHAAAILYGTGSILGLDDAAWKKYGLGALALVDNEDRYLETPGASNPHPDRNPYLHATSSLNAHDDGADEAGFYHDRSIEALRKRGASFFICNNALGHSAATIAKAHGLDAKAVKADFIAHLAPGTLLVPAGVATLNAAQEAKFTLFQATVA